MKKSPISRKKLSLRPEEEKGIGGACLLLENRKTLDEVHYYYPKCQHRFEATNYVPFLQVIKSWKGEDLLLIASNDLSVRRFPQAAMPPRFRKTEPASFLMILGSLMAGHTNRFFDAVRHWPEILQEREIWKRTVGLWYRQKIFNTPEGKQAKVYLKKVGSMLADPGGAPEFPTDEEREAKKKESHRKATGAFNARKKAKKA